MSAIIGHTDRPAPARRHGNRHHCDVQSARAEIAAELLCSLNDCGRFEHSRGIQLRYNAMREDRLASEFDRHKISAGTFLRNLRSIHRVQIRIAEEVARHGQHVCVKTVPEARRYYNSVECVA